MNIKKVTLASSGVLGAQIAFQTSFHGYDVMVYDISDEILKKTKNTFQKLGVASGEGFYTYPNPFFKDANFLK